VYSGDSTYVGTVSPVEPLTVTTSAKSETGITTSADPSSVIVGSTTMQDTAALSGNLDKNSDTRTGNITFYLFAPSNTPLSGYSNAVYSETVQVNNGFSTYSTTGTGTGSEAATETGSYEWVAVHNDGDNYAGSQSNFGDEPVTILPTLPTRQRRW
jgi:hypothetical protein